MTNETNDIEAVALLAEPVRRALYDWVVGAGRAVSRDEAAAAVGASRALAAFHLDRLVGDGILAAEYRRLTGRSGPGAGRPAKLYRRGLRAIAVSFPERRYEVPAHLLAQAIEQIADDVPPDALRAAAVEVGREAGQAARERVGRRSSRRRRREALVAALRERGYEPFEAPGGEIRLANCPFDALVADHRQLVCGMNVALAGGLIDGLGERALAARLDPQPGMCCVAIAPGNSAAGSRAAT
jgi:predicted ArsR family transcriptional regulator